MKMIIKISKDSYEAICNGHMLPPDVKNVINAIKNGKPINAVPVSEIKDVITKINQRYPGQLMYNSKYMISVEEVTNILNEVIENAETKCAM